MNTLTGKRLSTFWFLRASTQKAVVISLCVVLRRLNYGYIIALTPTGPLSARVAPLSGFFWPVTAANGAPPVASPLAVSAVGPFPSEGTLATVWLRL